MEGDVEEDAEVPVVDQFGSLAEDAVEQQYGVGRGFSRAFIDRRIRAPVEDGMPVTPMAAWSERVEELGTQCCVVERVVVVPLGRVRTAAVSLRPRPVEAVDGRPDDVATPAFDVPDELVRHHRFAGAVNPIYSNPDRVGPLDARDEVGEVLQ
jgi:hypothetical protein